jgi:hypothetical protein
MSKTLTVIAASPNMELQMLGTEDISCNIENSIPALQKTCWVLIKRGQTINYVLGNNSCLF